MKTYLSEQNTNEMRFILIEDRIFKITDEQYAEIQKVKQQDDESLLLELFDKSEQYYLLVGYVEFSFRS